ncbi:MAG: DegT/DnrJ/EryC1/StrS family aminotransferase [Thermoguttaceae bacterium]|nr:DegT/DnrJ/EryC1/StrS family aminotransferase [Thermoguttaceae bacterium]
MTHLTRRDFLKNGALASGAVLTGSLFESSPVYGAIDPDGKPAILGGEGVSYNAGPSWPVLNGDELERLDAVLKSRNWCRSGNPACVTNDFEAAYAEMCGAKHCIAVNSGTSALIASLSAFEIGPGDEVITSPYTFIATVNCIIDHYALPVFADVDLNSFQICPQATEKLITPNTRVLLPVHIGGAPAQMDAFLDVASRHGNLPIVEDACQAHLGKWRGKYLGTLGSTGCFSMQVTKNLSCGDGGAILTNDDRLADRLYKIHSNSRAPVTNSMDFQYDPLHASNMRMTGFQAALLLSQLPSALERVKIRNENALYLASLLREIPGVYPQEIYDGGESAWHLFMSRIVEEEFGCSRDRVSEAMAAEGVNVSFGYSTGDWINYIRSIYSTSAARRVYSEKDLDDWAERIQLPNLEKVCAQGLWILQTQLLAPRENMEVIADCMRRIQKHSAEIAQLET